LKKLTLDFIITIHLLIFLLKMIQQILIIKQTCASTSNNLYELQQYLNEPMISKDTKALDWWKLNCNQFSNLFKIAKDFLAILATSVPSEHIFSLANRIVDDNCTNLDSNTVKAL
ncbi:30522_t:CDS:1, partial [Gigaspora margarita]